MADIPDGELDRLRASVSMLTERLERIEAIEKQRADRAGREEEIREEDEFLRRAMNDDGIE